MVVFFFGLETVFLDDVRLLFVLETTEEASDTVVSTDESLRVLVSLVTVEADSVLDTVSEEELSVFGFSPQEANDSKNTNDKNKEIIFFKTVTPWKISIIYDTT